MIKAIGTGLFGLVLLGWAGPISAQSVSPYAGQQSREIKGSRQRKSRTSF